MKYLAILSLLALASCATKKPAPEPKKTSSWSERKRECHSFYINSFGLSADNAIGICREEMGVAYQ